MTHPQLATAEIPDAAEREAMERTWRRKPGLWGWLTTTDNTGNTPQDEFGRMTSYAPSIS